MFGLSFLNTSFLIFLSSLILPIIVYLITKKKPKQVFFSSIRFIKQSVQKRKKKINLKNILLLIIRLLILLFIILGLSRPVIKKTGKSFSKNHPKTAVAIIVDNSYSMDYLLDTETELDKAKEIVKEINPYLTGDDISLLITRDEQWNKLNTGLNYGKIPENIIGNIKITPVAISVKSVFDTAEKYLKKSDYINKEIYFITDFQNEEYPNKFAIPTLVINTSDHEYKKNLAVIKTKVSVDFTGDKKKRTIEFTVKNFSNTEQTEAVCKIVLDDKTISEKVIRLAPFQAKSSSFNINVEKEGWHSGYIKVKNERLEYDNKNYFSFYIKENPKVAIISSLDEFPLSLVAILQIYSADIKILKSDEVDFNIFSNYDNIILYKPEFNNKLLDVFKSQKKFLAIIDKDDSKEIINFYQALFKIKIGEYYNAQQALTIDKVNRFSDVTKILKEIKKTPINYFYKLDKNNSQILLSASNNPISLMNENGSILWNFSLENDNPLLISSMFPVFAFNSLMATASFEYNLKDKVVGDKLELPHKKAILPDGKMVYAEDNKIIANKAGIYLLYDKKVAVNLDFNESEYKKHKKIKSRNVIVTKNNWKNYLFRNGFGRDIWKYFFLIALLLFIIEMIIIKTEEKK